MGISNSCTNLPTKFDIGPSHVIRKKNFSDRSSSLKFLHEADTSLNSEFLPAEKHGHIIRAWNSSPITSEPACLHRVHSLSHLGMKGLEYLPVSTSSLCALMRNAV